VLCGKPRVKCANCENRQFIPVSAEVIHGHLSGKCTIGVYPILKDETCWFLAVDFDKSGWELDALAFLDSCDTLGIPAYLERSRSGLGGHVWMFFDSPIPANRARSLGSAVLTSTMEQRPEIGFDSYDRLFPSQDTLPKGGFGNLIALPLQKIPREQGNSVFVDRELKVVPDQWSYLSQMERITARKAEEIIRKTEDTGDLVGVRRALALDDAADDPWTLSPSGKSPEPPISCELPSEVRIVISNQIFLEKEALPPVLTHRLIRIAAFQNPEFYRAQAMRLSAFGKPRVIACAEDYPRHIGLPRGCLDNVLSLMNENEVSVKVIDERFAGNAIQADFHGSLRDEQKGAARTMLDKDTGILSAATAFGKTVVASWIIAQRKVNTLVLVHRRNLMEQWCERLACFLDLPKAAIGQVGGGRRKITGEIDVAVLQSLNRKGEVDDLVASYGQVIVDEAHHLSAFSFEQILKQVKARYVMGLTATPVRKDGHHPIILMQCGPIRYRVKNSVRNNTRATVHRVIPRVTEFSVSESDSEKGIQAIYAALAENEIRNEMIFDDVLLNLEEGRSPILLTERTDHLEWFENHLRRFAKNLVVMRGGQGRKAQTKVFEQLASIPPDEERLIIATGRYVGEGFDDPRLDTLFLTLPISWRGTLQQYVGRLHRQYEGKNELRVYDYVDQDVPVLRRMYDRRRKGYQAMGYEIADAQSEGFLKGINNSLVS
jgi:superfamily II DNA or RNA helicase